MHKPSLQLGSLLLSQLFVSAVLAQEPGAGTPVPAPHQKLQAQDKADGKAKRQAEGRAAARAGHTGGEITPAPAPRAQLQPSKEERQQARAARKAETARAARAGELQPQGEVGALR